MEAQEKQGLITESLSKFVAMRELESRSLWLSCVTLCLGRPK